MASNLDIVLAAINSLSGESIRHSEYESRVTERALKIQSLLRDSSPTMRALDSVRIYAHVDSVKYEENTTRYVVTFTPKNGDEQEQIRTPRMDTQAGKLIENKVKGAAGHDAIIYKNNEPAPEGAKGKQVPSHGYRVMPWIQVLS